MASGNNPSVYIVKQSVIGVVDCSYYLLCNLTHFIDTSAKQLHCTKFEEVYLTLYMVNA